MNDIRNLPFPGEHGEALLFLTNLLEKGSTGKIPWGRCFLFHYLLTPSFIF
jgi:hypothetical protein